MNKRQIILLGVLGALIAGLTVAVVVIATGGGDASVLAESVETTTTGSPDPAPDSTVPPAPAPPETTPQTSVPETVATTEAVPITFPPPIVAVAVERVANPIEHSGFTDVGCDGLVLDFADVAPREMRLPGEPVARVRTAVIVDMSSEPASLEEAEYSLEEAGKYLYDLTGFGFEMTEYVEAHPPDGDFIKAAIPHCYLQTLGDLPDHVILYSFGLYDNARTFGGYAEYLDSRSPVAYWAPTGWSNRFTNVTLGGVQMYVTVIHWSHEYARCGYGSSDTPVSDVAIEGECRGREGTLCVAGPEYQICPDELGSPFAYRANYRASTIVHELMHPFGKWDNGDHFGAAACNSEMGWPEGTFDEAAANQHHQMCPYTYELFAAGFTG